MHAFQTTLIMVILFVSIIAYTYQAPFYSLGHIFIQAVDSLTFQYKLRIVFKNNLKKLNYKLVSFNNLPFPFENMVNFVIKKRRERNLKVKKYANMEG